MTRLRSGRKPPTLAALLGLRSEDLFVEGPPGARERAEIGRDRAAPVAVQPDADERAVRLHRARVERTRRDGRDGAEVRWERQLALAPPPKADELPVRPQRVYSQ